MNRPRPAPDGCDCADHLRGTRTDPGCRNVPAPAMQDNLRGARSRTGAQDRLSAVKFTGAEGYSCAASDAEALATQMSQRVDRAWRRHPAAAQDTIGRLAADAGDGDLNPPLHPIGGTPAAAGLSAPLNRTLFCLGPGSSRAEKEETRP